VLSHAAHELGFEHCSYGLRMPLPLCAPRFLLYSDYPKSWEHKYVSSNYFAIDPTVKHALTQSTPLVWEADRQLQSPEFWEEASYHGLRHGWCMPTRDGRGTIALATMVRSVESVSAQEL
jgi:LuxR family transcriptional regulator